MLVSQFITALKGCEPEEQECVDTLLKGVPDEGGVVPRPVLEHIIRAAFQGGLTAAHIKHQCQKISQN